MSLCQAASLSCDCVTNGLAFLTTAYFLRCAFGEYKLVSRRDILILLVLTAFLSLSKNVYFPLMFLYLLIPVRKLVSAKRYITILLLFIVLNLGLAGLWNFSAKSFAVPDRRIETTKKQIEYVCSDFSVYPAIIARTIRMRSALLYKSYIGIFGWCDTQLPRWHGWAWGLLLIFAALTDTIAL